MQIGSWLFKIVAPTNTTISNEIAHCYELRNSLAKEWGVSVKTSIKILHLIIILVVDYVQVWKLLKFFKWFLNNDSKERGMLEKVFVWIMFIFRREQGDSSRNPIDRKRTNTQFEKEKKKKPVDVTVYDQVVKQDNNKKLN